MTDKAIELLREIRDMLHPEAFVVPSFIPQEAIAQRIDALLAEHERENVPGPSESVFVPRQCCSLDGGRWWASDNHFFDSENLAQAECDRLNSKLAQAQRYAAELDGYWDTSGKWSLYESHNRVTFQLIALSNYGIPKFSQRAVKTAATWANGETDDE